MLAIAQAIALRGLHLNLVDTGAEIIPGATDEIVALADFNVRLARAIAVEADFHDPVADPLALHHRIGRHVEILDRKPVASPAAAAAPVGLRAGIGGEAADQHEPGERRNNSCPQPTHSLPPWFSPPAANASLAACGSLSNRS